MRKNLILAIAATAVISFSCKKERSCSCTVTSMTTTISGNQTTVENKTRTEKYTLNDLTKKQAAAACSSYNKTGNNTGTSAVTYSNTTNTSTQTGNGTETRNCTID